MATFDKWLQAKSKAVTAFAIECDSAAAIEGAGLTPAQRAELQKQLDL